MNEKEIINILRKVSIALLGIVFFAFPLLFLTNTTDPFILPRQIFIVITSFLLVFLWAVISVLQKKIIIRTNPFTLPLSIFTVIIIISAILSRNMYDSLAVSIPVLACFLLYFVTIHIVSSKKDFLFIGGSLMIGAVLTTALSILYYFKIYILPISQTHNQYFTTFGSPIQHILYILPLFIICLLAVLSLLKGRFTKVSYEQLFNIISGVILLVGVGLIAYQILTVSQKPNLLPYTYGFQIATAAISQDSSRFLLALPFGSGYGTFLSDYTRFKFPSINNNPTLWNYQFTYSSSFVLELLTTTGVLGFLSYLFVVFRVLKNRSKNSTPIFLGILSILILSFFLPFSLSEVFLLFALIGLYTATLFLADDKRVDTIKISLVALKEGLISMEETQDPDRKYKKDSRILPGLFALIVLLVGGYISYLSVQLLIADTKMAKSLSQPANTKLDTIYDLQREALITYPYRSDYYRIFSQLNLGLATSISQGVPQGTQPSAQIQQTVSQLLKQAVDNGRTAVAIAPITAVNWENLAGIYRNLIGVGQNADQFSIATLNQAIALDPSNPVLRVELGGIYYALQQYDAAQTQFAQAIQLKPDFANAYYNLGHALEAKGDLSSALSAYQSALSLVQNNPQDKTALQKEIDVLSEKIGNKGESNEQTKVPGNAENQPPLGLTAPTTVPSVTGQVKVPPPPTGSVGTPIPTSTQ